MGFGSFLRQASACSCQIRTALQHHPHVSKFHGIRSIGVARPMSSLSAGSFYPEKATELYSTSFKSISAESSPLTQSGFRSRPRRATSALQTEPQKDAGTHLSSLETTNANSSELQKESLVDSLLLPAIADLRLADATLQSATYLSNVARYEKSTPGRLVWEAIASSPLKSELDGQSTGALWRILLSWSSSSDADIRRLLDLLEQSKQENGKLRVDSYELVMLQMIQENHLTCLKWHAALLERGCHPSKRSVFKLAEVARCLPSSLQTFGELYKILPSEVPAEDLFRIIVPYLWERSRFKEARHWHAILSAGNAISSDLEEALAACSTVEDLQSANRTEMLGELTGAANILSLKDKHLMLPLNIPASLPTRLGGDKSPAKWDDDFGARFFATTSISINVLLNAAQFLGVRELGPRSVREILRRQSDSVAMVGDLDRLYELGFNLDQSHFCRLIARLASARRLPVLEQVVLSEQPVEFFSDQQQVLLSASTSFHQEQWTELQLVMVTLETLRPDEGLLWRMQFEDEINRAELNSAKTSLQKMDLHDITLQAETLHGFSRLLYMGDSSTWTSETFQIIIVAMKFLLVEMVNVSGQIFLERWKQLLSGLSMNKKMQDVRRIGLWLIDIQRFQAFSAITESKKAAGKVSDPVFLRTTDTIRKPSNLVSTEVNHAFSGSFIEGMCLRAFSTSTKYSLASFSRTGYENLSLMSPMVLENYLEQCAQCVLFIRGLQGRGVRISEWQILRAFHQAYIPIRSTQRRMYGRGSMASSYQKLLKVMQAIEEAWGSAIFDNKELEISREAWTYGITGRTWPELSRITIFLRPLLAKKQRLVTYRPHLPLRKSCFAGQLSLSLTTSFPKRRRLDQSDRARSPSEESSSVASTESADHTLVAPRTVNERTVRSKNSPSPSRASPAPGYLGVEGKDRLLTSESQLGGLRGAVSTAGSSPLVAYASLSLDSSGDMPNLEEQPNSREERPPKTSTLKQHRKNLSSTGSNISRRCASPAKRPAPTAEPEDERFTDSEMAPDKSARRKQSQDGAEASRHARSVSVDMMGDEGIGSETTSLDTSQTLQSVAESDTTLADSTTTESGGVRLDAKPVEESLPSIEDQISEVERMAQSSLKEGEKLYALSAKWLSRVINRRPGTKVPSDQADSVVGEIGPVDNFNLVDYTLLRSLSAKAAAANASEDTANFDDYTDLVKDDHGARFIPINTAAEAGEEFQMLPEAAWNRVVEWYGIKEGSPVIIRYAYDSSSTFANVVFDAFPLACKVFRFNSNPKEGEPERISRTIVASKYENYQSFLKRVKTAFKIGSETKIQLWQISGRDATHNDIEMLTPAASRSNTPAEDAGDDFDRDTFLRMDEQNERILVNVADNTANANYDGKTNLGTLVMIRNQTLVIEERVGSGVRANSKASRLLPQQSKANGKRAEEDSGRRSPAPKSQYATRGRSRPTGVVGLMNLGNSCYMNSALQCLRNIDELSRYFLEGKHKQELNPSNPLAHNGKVALAYGELLNQIFSPTAGSSVQPRDFKRTIGHYGPSFSGYGQQDSQEFLGFLLDGLSEDLNRIQKKPYIENPDSTDEMVQNPAAIAAFADQCWDIYKARNDSVVVDLFAGSYKSTLVCPVCDKISITFDPFTTLTLQLPIENIWSKDVIFYSLHGPPCRISIDMDKNGSLKGLKEVISQQTGVPVNRLIGAEIYKNKFFKIYDDFSSVSDAIGNNDEPAFYELEHVPTNYPQKKSNSRERSMLTFSYERDDLVPAWDSPEADCLVVPVFNRAEGKGSRIGGGRAFFGYPFFLTLLREEARDPEVILRKIIAKAVTMTTYDLCADLLPSKDGASSKGTDDGDMVDAPDEDNSSGDSRIKAHSINGEDGLVNISVASNSPDELAQSSLASEKPANLSQIKMIMNTAVTLAADARQMFKIKILPSKGEAIPTGWSSLNESMNCEPLESRIPQEQDAASDNGSHDSSAALISSPNDAQSTMSSSAVFSHKMQDSVNDISEDDAMSPIEQSTEIEPEDAASTHSSTTNVEHTASPPLVQPGEAIVLDWYENVYDALFAQEAEGLRGAGTWIDMETKIDPELGRKRKLRTQKRNRGISLNDCLDEFAKEEVLSENDAWYCPRCKTHRRATKKFELWKTPDILVIHLKRFSSNRTFRDKIDAQVDFPVEGLDLQKRITRPEDGKAYIYDLVGVDNHYGGLGGGHYTAYAQNRVDKVWYNFDDSSVHKLDDAKRSVTTAAYLLFYRRRSDKILGGTNLEALLKPADDSSSDDSDSDSPSGDEERLDDTSRDGSSDAFGQIRSALSGTGANLHHHEGGGQGAGKAAEADDGDSLPEYSDLAPLTAEADAGWPPQALTAAALQSRSSDFMGNLDVGGSSDNDSVQVALDLDDDLAGSFARSEPEFDDTDAMIDDALGLDEKPRVIEGFQVPHLDAGGADDGPVAEVRVEGDDRLSA